MARVRAPDELHDPAEEVLRAGAQLTRRQQGSPLFELRAEVRPGYVREVSVLQGDLRRPLQQTEEFFAVGGLLIAPTRS